ncbi:MAG: ATP-binding protein [Anaerolineae bacterium]
MRELSLHILDIVQNSLEAGAAHITIEIDENLAEDRLTIRVTDNGQGMDAETLRRVTDPFFTTRATRHVGLGIPLLKAAAEQCGGRLTVQSAPGQGTTVTAEFQHSHIDRAPLGDMPASLMTILLAERPVEVRYVHRMGGREFVLDTCELREVLGEVPLTHPKIRQWLYDYLRQGEAGLLGASSAGADQANHQEG